MKFQRPIIRIPKYILVLIRTLSSFPRRAIQESLKFRIPCWEIPYSGYWMPLSGTWGAFHSLELTGQQTIAIIMRISLFTQNQPTEHTRRRWLSNKNSWKKAFFIVKMAGRAMIRPASSDFLKEPSDSGLQSQAVCRISFEPRILVSKSKKFPRFPNTGHATWGELPVQFLIQWLPSTRL